MSINKLIYERSSFFGILSYMCMPLFHIRIWPTQRVIHACWIADSKGNEDILTNILVYVHSHINTRVDIYISLKRMKNCILVGGKLFINLWFSHFQTVLCKTGNSSKTGKDFVEHWNSSARGNLEHTRFSGI